MLNITKEDLAVPREEMTISCPKCGKLNVVALVNGTTTDRMEHRCVNCGMDFSVDLEVLRHDPTQEPE